MSIHSNSNNSLAEREKHFIERLNDKYPNFEYIKGYTHSECEVLLKCKKCGEVMMKHSSLVRSRKNLTCFNCLKIKRENKEKRKKMLSQQRLFIIKRDIEKQKEIQSIYQKIKANTFYIGKCVRCNEEYIGKSTSKYCPKCRHIIRDSHSSKSLKKLYDRDKGICKICNGICNWNDKKVVNGTTIVGNTYPSIDHIIPLSKGGSDDWENLQLAHFKCNWLKGAC